METKSVTGTGTSGVIKTNNGPVSYDRVAARVNDRLNTALALGPVFHTNASDLNEAYLSAFPSAWIDHHRCNCCRHFLEQYGDLAYVDSEGRLRSALWNEEDAEDIYFHPFEMLRKSVERSKITGVFVPGRSEYGHPQTGIWRHFSFTVPANKVWRSHLTSAEQREAELKQDYILVRRTLAEYALSELEAGYELLGHSQMDRGDKVRGPIKWFADLQRVIAFSPFKDNLTWKATATAPTGFAHLRNSVAASGVLDRIKTGESFESIRSSFNKMTAGDKYQRPQAPPTEGSIDEAEKLVEKMGIQRSLLRQFAKVSDLQTFWTPTAVAPQEQPVGKIFAHLKSTPDNKPMSMPAEAMTWTKFFRDVLPTAKTLAVQVPRNGNYFGMLTAVFPDAPPILQWDDPEVRNTVSWYVYNEGSQAENWGLSYNSYVPVTALCDLPCRWHGKVNTNFKPGVMFVLEGAKDGRAPSMGLFPEILRPELRPVRSVIEAFSKSGTPADRETASACGLLMINDSWGHNVRVNETRIYKIDRWD